jgi:general secretion pathway protein G
MKNPKQAHRGSVIGFTLIELVISVAIVALLAGGAVSLLENTNKRAHEAELRADLREIRTAIDAYKAASDSGHIARAANASGYPASLEVLARGVEDARSPVKKKLFFLRRVPTDPMVDETKPVWGLRSYASEPDSPEAGADVYDVYSTSTKVGLNGVPYQKW